MSCGRSADLIDKVTCCHDGIAPQGIEQFWNDLPNVIARTLESAGGEGDLAWHGGWEFTLPLTLTPSTARIKDPNAGHAWRSGGTWFIARRLRAAGLAQHVSRARFAPRSHWPSGFASQRIRTPFSHSPCWQVRIMLPLTHSDSAHPPAAPDASASPAFTDEELQRAFIGQPHLAWLQDKLTANAPLSASDRVHLWLARCRVDELAGRIADASAAVQTAAALAAFSRDPVLHGSVDMCLAMLAVRQGQYDTAVAISTRALAQLGDHPDAAPVCSILGICALENNQFDAAEEYHLQSAHVARRFNATLSLALALHNLAHVNLWRGRHDLALRFAAEANDIQLEVGSVPHTWPLTAVQVFQLRNQRAEAWEALRLLAELAPRMTLYRVFVAIFAAQLNLDAEDLDAAQGEAERAHSLAERVGYPVANVLARLVNSRYRRLTGNAAAAIEWAMDAKTHAKRAGYGYMEALALLEEGAGHRQNGTPQAAIACWKAAADIAAALGARHEEAHARLLLAAHYRSVNHPDAEATWRQAAAAILENGYTYLLERERSIAFPLVADYARARDAGLRQTADSLLGRLASVAALPLHIRGLGAFSIRRGAHTIDMQLLRRRRAGELLRFLLIQPRLSAAREVVLETLWLDLSADSGQNLLHQATSALRRVLEPDLPDKFPSRYLQIGGEVIALRLPAGSTIDFVQFAACPDAPQATRAELDAAIALYSGDLFPEDRYADWAELPRTHLSERLHTLLLARAEGDLAAGDAAAAQRDCLRVLARDPCHEEAALIAMRAALATGNRPAALRHYHTLERALDRHFQLAPRQDVMQLAASLRRTNRSA